MNPNHQIIIYGVWEEAIPTGGCGCDPHTPRKRTGDLYEEMKRHLEDVIGTIDCQFVEMSDPMLQDPDDVSAMMQKEFPLPYTRVNGELKFNGGISKEALEILLTD